MRFLFFLFFCLSGVLSASEVIVTIRPLHSLVQAVMGNSGKARLLVDQASPHQFSLKPADIKAVQKAKICFFVDEEFEFFLKKVLPLNPNLKKVPFSQIKGILLLPLRTSDSWVLGSYKTRSFSKISSNDMHLWLNPKNAEFFVNRVAQDLAEIYPQNRSLYLKNAKKISQKLLALDNKIQKNLKGSIHKSYLVFHDAYQYFENRYKLSPSGVILVHPEKGLSIARLRYLRKQIKKRGIKVVFSEPQFPSRVVDVICENLPVRHLSIDPLGISLPLDENLYFQMMETLAQKFISAFSS